MSERDVKMGQREAKPRAQWGPVSEFEVKPRAAEGRTLSEPDLSQTTAERRTTSESEVNQRAAEWLVELQSSNADPPRWAAFEAWLAEDPAHREAYLETEAAWHDGEQIKALVFANDVSDPEVMLRRAGVRSIARTRRSFLEIGAKLVLGITLVILVGIPIREYLSWERFATARGEVLPIKLPDGSKIQLNTNSKMRVRIGKDVRDIALDTGEAFFDVEQDKTRPFIVRVSNTFVDATGTEFAVRRGEQGDVYALVMKGNVRVPKEHRSSWPVGVAALKAATMEVSAGEEVTVTPGGPPRLLNVGVDELRRKTAWRKGQLDFDGTIAEAVSELNRYSNRVLEIGDESIAGKHIQGIFPTTDPDEFARLLEQNLGIPYRSTGSAVHKDGKIILGGRAFQ